MARRDQGTIGAGGGGGWELHGGTGKYAAVTGRCTYQTQYLDDGWLVATGTCEVEQGRKHVGAYVPRHKRYLDEMPGKPLQDLWSVSG